MSNDTTDWKQLREFTGVDIARSYALSWKMEATSLVIDLDLYLQEEHPFYEEPRPSEKACFRPAFLEFPHCTRTSDGARDNADKEIGTIRPGKIAGLRRNGEGKYELRGDFGAIIVYSDRPLLRLKDLSV